MLTVTLLFILMHYRNAEVVGAKLRIEELEKDKLEM